MPEIEKFGEHEFSNEILTEWYQEKGIALSDIEKEKLRDKEKIPAPEFSIQASGKTDDDLRREEEEKKLTVKNKIKLLLAIGEKKGLEYSIKEAKKANDPFLLDIYHDVLAKDGAYKKFLAK
jgi:hypothetical protein